MVDKLVVYELKDMNAQQNNQSLFGLDFNSMVGGVELGSCWQFVFKYELRFEESFLFKHLYSQGIDCLEYFVSNPSLIKLDDAAKVKMCYCENLSPVEPDSDNSSDVSEFIQVRLVGAIFHQDESKITSKCEGFN